MGSLQFPNMGMGLRLAAFGRRSSAIKDLLKPKSPLSSDEHRQIWGYLFQFIDECNETGKKDVIFFWDFLFFTLFLKKVKVKSVYEHSGPSGWSLSLFL